MMGAFFIPLSKYSKLITATETLGLRRKDTIFFVFRTIYCKKVLCMGITAKYACDVLSERIPLTPNYDSGKTSYISAYGVFESNNGKKVIIRAADHGTYLFHWVDRNEGIDLSQTANYAITFKDNIDIIHNTEISGETNQIFVVRQYVYDCSILDAADVDMIVNAVINLAKDGVYTDPFINTPKHAVIWKEETNSPPKNITTKVAKHKRKREQKQAKKENNQEINENRKMNKKQVVKINEAQLNQIVAESVKKVLNELDWKTYANAAKKRALQGDPKGTMHDLSNATTMALRKKYPTPGYNYNDEYPSIETFNNDYAGHKQVGRVPGLGAYNPYDNIPTDTYVDEFDDDRESWSTKNRIPDELQQDMSDYFSGKSKYQKGKGWVKNNGN